MNYANLKHIRQAAWRVIILDFAARILGVLCHVEGIPIGSVRSIKKLYANDAKMGAPSTATYFEIIEDHGKAKANPLSASQLSKRD